MNLYFNRKKVKLKRERWSDEPPYVSCGCSRHGDGGSGSLWCWFGGGDEKEVVEKVALSVNSTIIVRLHDCGVFVL